MMNRIDLIGYLSFDPILKTSKKGESYFVFSLGVPKYGKKGQYNYFYCTAFKKTAEHMVQILKKRDRIMISGSVDINVYQQEGQKQTKFMVLVKSFQFISRKDGENSPDPDISFIDEEFEDFN